jgi:hypothetical protein
MASACYADDQARSSEGETSSEGTDGTGRAAQGWFQLLWSSIRWPLHFRFTDDFSSLDNHPTVPGTSILPLRGCFDVAQRFSGRLPLAASGPAGGLQAVVEPTGGASSEVSNVKLGFHELR